MVVNVAVALLGTLKVTISEEVPSASLSTASVLKIIQELLQVRSTLPLVALLELTSPRDLLYTPTHMYEMLRTRRWGAYVASAEIASLVI